MLPFLPCILSLVSPAGESPARFLPADSLAYLEVPGLSPLASEGLQHPLVERLIDSPLGMLLQQEAKFPPAFGLWMLNRQAGLHVLPTVGKLTEGGLALSLLGVDGDDPRYCAVALGDAEAWDEVAELVRTRIEKHPEGPLATALVSRGDRHGVDVWDFGDHGTLAIEGGRIFAASSRALVEQLLDSEGEGLLGNEDFVHAHATYRSATAFAWGWFDLDGLEEVGEGLSDLRRVPAEPASQLLLGPAVANIAGARQATFELRLAGEELSFEVVGLDAPEGTVARLLAPEDSRPPAMPAALGGEAATAMVYRDLATVFRQRGELFAPRVQPRFAEATSNLALFFGGQDITDEVLPGLDSWIGLVAREVDFDERAIPEVPLPGMAFLIHLREPESMGPQLVAAVQSLLSLINVEAAQNQEPVMTVQLELHEGVSVTYGRYRVPAEGEGVDARYNLEPACAWVGDTFVLGTHRALVKELVGQLVHGDMVTAPEGEVFELSGQALFGALEANAEALVLNAVLKEGKSEEQARKEQGFVRAFTGMVDTLRFETARPAARDLRASLRLLFLEPVDGGEQDR